MADVQAPPPSLDMASEKIKALSKTFNDANVPLDLLKSKVRELSKEIRNAIDADSRLLLGKKDLTKADLEQLALMSKTAAEMAQLNKQINQALPISSWQKFLDNFRTVPANPYTKGKVTAGVTAAQKTIGNIISPPSLLTATPGMLPFAGLAVLFKELLSFGADTMRSMRVVAGTGGIGSGAGQMAANFAGQQRQPLLDNKEMREGAEGFLKTSSLTGAAFKNQSTTMTTLTNSIADLTMQGKVLGFTAAESGAMLGKMGNSFHMTLNDSATSMQHVINASMKMGLSVGDTVGLFESGAERLRWGTSGIKTFNKALEQTLWIAKVQREAATNKAFSGGFMPTAADMKEMMTGLNATMKSFSLESYAGLVGGAGKLSSDGLGEMVKSYWAASPMDAFMSSIGTYTKAIAPGAAKGSKEEINAVRTALALSPEFKGLGSMGLRVWELSRGREKELEQFRKANPGKNALESLTAITGGASKAELIRMGQQEAILGDPMKSIVIMMTALLRLAANSWIVKGTDAVGKMFGGMTSDATTESIKTSVFDKSSNTKSAMQGSVFSGGMTAK